MKKLYLLLFLIALAAFIGGFYWDRLGNKLGEVDFKIENISYGGGNDAYLIEGKYPVLSGGLSKKALDRMNKEIKDFASESVSVTKSEFDVLAAEMEEIGSSAKLQYSNEVTVTSDFSKLPFINITLEIYYYSGGAHGMTAVKTFVFDARDGSVLNLQNIFTGAYLGALSNLSLEILKDKDPEGEVYVFAEEGTLPDANNFQSFTLENDGLRIVFGDYQVGPYVIGHPDITIPYEKLLGVMRPEFKELVVNN